jgi:hypothetical protein
MTMSDEKLYAEIRAAQAIAAENLQRRWGMSNEQLAQARTAIAAPATPTVTTADMEAAWARSAEHQARSLGIEPVSDAEAAAIQAKMDEATAKYQAARAGEMDETLRQFRQEWDRGQTDPTSIYYRADPAHKEKVEEGMMLARLRAGLPAEPGPRKTPEQRARERYDAERKAQQS